MVLSNLMLPRELDPPRFHSVGIPNICERNIRFKIAFQFTLECGGTTSLGILLLIFNISED